MMDGIHIFTERVQPATNFVDTHGLQPRRVRCSPRRLWCVDCCRTRRWAKYVRVQIYHDKVNRFCADGHGCKKKGG